MKFCIGFLIIINFQILRSEFSSFDFKMVLNQIYDAAKGKISTCNVLSNYTFAKNFPTSDH